MGTVYDVNLDINGLGPVRKQARWDIHQIIRDRQQGPCSDRLRARRHLYGCSLPVFITGPCKWGGGEGGGGRGCHCCPFDGQLFSGACPLVRTTRPYDGALGSPLRRCRFGGEVMLNVLGCRLTY